MRIRNLFSIKNRPIKGSIDRKEEVKGRIRVGTIIFRWKTEGLILYERYRGTKHRQREIGRQSLFLFRNFLIFDIKRLGDQLFIKFRDREIIYEELIEGKERMRDSETLKSLKL